MEMNRKTSKKDKNGLCSRKIRQIVEESLRTNG